MLKEVFSMWKNTAKSGNVYYSGKYNGYNIVAFTNRNAGEKLPYLRFYIKGDELTECGAVWYHNTTGKKPYLSGTIGKDTRITGFFNKNASAENRQPTLRFYVDDPDAEREQTEIKTEQAEQKKDRKPSKAKTAKAKKDANGDLPF